MVSLQDGALLPYSLPSEAEVRGSVRKPRLRLQRMYPRRADRILGNVTKYWAPARRFRLLASIDPSQEQGTLKPALYCLCRGQCLVIHQFPAALIESYFALNGMSLDVMNRASTQDGLHTFAARLEVPQRSLFRPDQSFRGDWSSDRKFGKWIWVVIRFPLGRCIRRSAYLRLITNDTTR